MVIFLTGVMGSGKTYEAISRIYAYFGKDENMQGALLSKYIINKDIKYLRTNVPYYKEKFNIDDNVDTSFKFEKFYEKIKLLHIYYLDNVTSEEKLLEYAVNFGIAYTYFVIDECHNYLDNQDKALIFFFTYHRHFYCEVLLITQNLPLVHYKYKGFCEQFIKVLPSSFNLSDKYFTYKYYPNSRMSAKDCYETIQIKKYQLLFDCYKSGGKVFTNNKIKKIILTSIFSFIVLGTIIYILFGYLFPSAPVEEIKEVNNTLPIEIQSTRSAYKNTSNQFENIEDQDYSISYNDTDLKLFKFTCFDTLCYYRFEDNEVFEIPQNILKTYLLDIKPDKKYLELKNNRLSIYVLVPNSIFHFIKQEEKKNDETNKNTVLPSFNLK